MKTKLIFLLPLLVTLLFAACAPVPADTNPGMPIPSGVDGAVVVPAERVVGHQILPDGTTPEMRTALLVEIEGEIIARENSEAEFSSASVGLQLAVGGELQTGETGRGRIDLVPDGTIVRMGNNSYMIVRELSTQIEAPMTRLQLFFGQVWILLNGGDIELETTSGLAIVRGSMMSVSYDPENGDMEVTCLEGHCSLENDLGHVDLIAGEASSIPGTGAAPNDPYPMHEDDYEEWREAVPETAAFASEPIPGSMQPPPPYGAEPGAPPPPDDPAFTEPITYNFTNLCWATWHWEFSGDKTYTVDVPPGDSVSGEIPPGIYAVHDWADNGFDNGTYESVGGSHFDTTYNCPDPDSGGEGDPPPPSDAGGN